MQNFLIGRDAERELAECQEFARLPKKLANHFSNHLSGKPVPIHFALPHLLGRRFIIETIVGRVRPKTSLFSVRMCVRFGGVESISAVYLIVDGSLLL